MYQSYRTELARHKISLVGFHTIYGRYPRLHGKNARLSYHGYGCEIRIVVIRTDTGAMGWGACGGVYGYSAQADDAPSLLGLPVSEVFDAEVGIVDPKYSLYDIALHDLAGMILGIPVYKMINPEAEGFSRIYDGAIYMDDIIPEENPFGVSRVVQDCLDDYALGHRAFKVKIGRGSMWMPRAQGDVRDVDVMKAIHAALPSATLMVDANDGFTPQSMIHFLEKIPNIPLYWIEEPFWENEQGNRILKEYLLLHRPATLIADGEREPDLGLLQRLMVQGTLDVIQPDVCGFGFTRWRTLMQGLAKSGKLASPHAWGDVVKTHYCSHLCAAYPMHIPWIEAVLGDTEGVDYSGYVLQDGLLHIPDKPGFGMDLIYSR